MDLDITQEMSADVAMAACQRIVRSVTGATDPTYGGLLTINVQTLSLRTLDQAETAAAQDDHAQDCYVELTGAGALTGTIIGLGDRPLPLK